MNTLFLVGGNSGAGKTTAMRSLGLQEIVSFTTRQPREGELDGVDYHFISDDTYKSMMRNGSVIEHHNHISANYGITSHELYSKLEYGDAFAIVDIHGVQMLQARHPKCVSIFIYSSYEDSLLNMKQRGEEDRRIIERLSTYHWEVAQRNLYDYSIKNVRGALESTTNILKNIVQIKAKFEGETNILLSRGGNVNGRHDQDERE